MDDELKMILGDLMLKTLALSEQVKRLTAENEKLRTEAARSEINGDHQ